MQLLQYELVTIFTFATSSYDILCIILRSFTTTHTLIHYKLRRTDHA